MSQQASLFTQADILLYTGADPTAFSVAACDQYTSEPDYWERVRRRAGEKPSALRLVFPEAWLKTAPFEDTVASINRNMQAYLDEGLFREIPHGFLYVERTLRNGKVRKGLIGQVDLEGYDYQPGSRSPIRATEGTVLDRIPPRVRIRENAPLELPHVMLLMDDRERRILEPLGGRKASFERVYGFPLMEDSGALEGWLLPEEEAARISKALAALADPSAFEEQYGIHDAGVLAFAVGDGNHSLAAARKCYLNLKERIGEEAALRHPARYALAELVNLHDESLEFEAIHRIVRETDPEKLLEALERRFRLTETPQPDAQRIDLVLHGESRPVYIANPSRNLAVGTLQEFLDGYIAAHGGEIDYIHGADVVRSLSMEKRSIGFLLEAMDKNRLFPTVALEGALPRKTFSMGEAWDKRFYFEARRIR